MVRFRKVIHYKVQEFNEQSTWLVVSNVSVFVPKFEECLGRLDSLQNVLGNLDAVEGINETLVILLDMRLGKSVVGFIALFLSKVDIVFKKELAYFLKLLFLHHREQLSLLHVEHKHEYNGNPFVLELGLGPKHHLFLVEVIDPLLQNDSYALELRTDGAVYLE